MDFSKYKLRLNRNNIILIAFLLPALIVSLFPPFEWGKEKLKTLSERRSNSIIDELPIKCYDLVFNSNKKYFKIGDYNFEKKYYPVDYKRLNKILGDALSYRYESGVDTFKSNFRLAYKKTKEMLLEEIKTKETINKSNNSKKNDDDSYRTVRQRIKQIQFNNFDWSEMENDYFIKQSKNYKEIKNDFEKNPKEWTTRIESHIDSVKIYRLYNIKKPEYYLLNREILTLELIINYILSFFVGIGLSFIIAKIRK
ncbi:MAG: hypothetical protein IPH11_04820 [Ignavibacteriales bacterium]|nr:hypothetical protein [Ignavibacteriales bacterium]